jgi:hypothetical protein
MDHQEGDEGSLCMGWACTLGNGRSSSIAIVWSSWSSLFSTYSVLLPVRGGKRVHGSPLRHALAILG